MLKKRILSFCLVLTMLLCLTGCSGYRESDMMKVSGDTESLDPLRICIDLGTIAPDSMMLAGFVNRLKEKAGVGIMENDYERSDCLFRYVQ